ncbi:transcription factor HES-4 [Topomyia yanbarensis]|uniref:transcription factor HES-4 n=1 Tax=Topomyia yanbarensis TaxID=2498891 RepID=UPI00273AFF29|nr:transcription factor HES-4 [Topomyia yanbarensis]
MERLEKDDHHGGGNRDAESYLRRIKAEIRKTNKPIMEKKRRARINNYLNDLKALLLDAMKKDPIRHSKLEKADILDLTVKHLQDLERRKLAIAMAMDPTVVDKFKNGFNECIDEIDKYLNSVPGVDSGMKQRISSHLKTYLRFQRFPQPGVVGAGPFGSLFGRSTDDINNNGRLAVEGMPLIPSLLPSGELAFIMPHQSGSTLPFFPRIPVVPGVPSRHFKPIPQEKQPYAPSPPLSPVSDQESVKSEQKTPLIKTRPALMESLLSAFPTPPTPDEGSRISAFRPNLKLIDRIRLHREAKASSHSEEQVSKRRRVEKADTFSDDESEHEEEVDAKDQVGGDMWRPW